MLYLVPLKYLLLAHVKLDILEMAELSAVNCLMKLIFFFCAFQLNADYKIQSSTMKSVFTTVNQMFGGSFQLPTTAELAVIKSLSTV